MTTASFVYDAFGRRRSKTIGGTTTQFVYDGLNPVQELNGSNVVTANLLTGLGTDEYFARADSSGTTAFLTDALGSTVGLVGSGGSIGTGYTYQPFGATTVAGSNANSYQFTGRENDATGLYYYRARYYSPISQRFTAQDPLGMGGGDAALYSYVQNDPVNFLDPTGQDAFTGGLIGAIGGAESGWIYSNGSYSATLLGLIGGGLAGAAVGAFNPTDIGAGAAGGFVGGLIGNGISQGLRIASDPCGHQHFNWGSFVGSGLGGAGVGAITGAVPAGADNTLLAKVLTKVTLGPLGPGLGIAIEATLSSPDIEGTSSGKTR